MITTSADVLALAAAVAAASEVEAERSAAMAAVVVEEERRRRWTPEDGTRWWFRKGVDVDIVVDVAPRKFRWRWGLRGVRRSAADAAVVAITDM
jgi:hypothetical protein